MQFSSGHVEGEEVNHFGKHKTQKESKAQTGTSLTKPPSKQTGTWNKQANWNETK